MTDITGGKKNRFSAHPILFTSLFIIILIVISLILVESYMRFKGKRPGYIGMYRLVADTGGLIDYKTFYSDSEGVFKATPTNRQFKYNSDGFRSIEFKPAATGKKKILFIGDSFTWGQRARPITNAFVDRVGRAGYTAYNTGTPGTDLTQYAFLAEKYIPLLKPDIVAVAFFVGNDLNGPLPMESGKPLYYATSKGWLYGYDKYGTHLSLKEAYAQVHGVMLPRVPVDKRNAGLQSLFMKTVVGTYIWVGISRHKSELFGDKKKSEDHVQALLGKIRSAAKENGARFMLFLIPAHPAERKKGVGIKENLHRFEGFDPIYTEGFTEDFYVPLPDGHFNNAGHEKYANFILKTLKSAGY
ncbi:MAG: SGNH/GDSL hydrolase family protein [Thermodesulfobacteriota bacterium]